MSSGARRVPEGQLEADTHIAAGGQEGASGSRLPDLMHNNPLASSSSPTASQQLAGIRTSPRLAASGLRNVRQFLDHITPSKATYFQGRHFPAPATPYLTPEPEVVVLPLIHPVSPGSHQQSAVEVEADSGMQSPVPVQHCDLAQLFQEAAALLGEGSGTSETVTTTTAVTATITALTDVTADRSLEPTSNSQVLQLISIFSAAVRMEVEEDTAWSPEEYECFASVEEQDEQPRHRNGQPKLAGTDQKKTGTWFSAEGEWLTNVHDRLLPSLPRYIKILIGDTVPSSLARNTFMRVLAELLTSPAIPALNTDPAQVTADDRRGQLEVLLQLLESKTHKVFQPSPLTSRMELEQYVGFDPDTQKPFTSPQAVADHMQELYNSCQRNLALVQSESQIAMQLSAILDSLFKDPRGVGLGQQAVNRITLDGVRDRETAVLRSMKYMSSQSALLGQ